MDPERNYASWVPVESSNLHSVIWYEDRTTGVGMLGVRFGGQKGRPITTYDYIGVPESVYQGLLAAPSKGKYHAANIKNKYPWR